MKHFYVSSVCLNLFNNKYNKFIINFSLCLCIINNVDQNKMAYDCIVYEVKTN